MQLHITFGGDGLTLPLHYRSLIHGMIYALLGDSPEINRIHDSRSFKGFTFSPVQGRYQLDNGSIRFDAGCSLQIRTYDRQQMRKLMDGLMGISCVQLGTQQVPVACWTVKDEHQRVTRAQIMMRSPAVTYVTDEAGHTLFYNPQQEEFYQTLVGNARKKWEQFGDGSPFRLEVRLKPGSMPRKVFDIFRRTYITGYTGVYMLEGKPEIIDLLYQIGLGAKSSDGFGMFDVLASEETVRGA